MRVGDRVLWDSPLCPPAGTSVGRSVPIPTRNREVSDPQTPRGANGFSGQPRPRHLLARLPWGEPAPRSRRDPVSRDRRVISSVGKRPGDGDGDGGGLRSSRRPPPGLPGALRSGLEPYTWRPQPASPRGVSLSSGTERSGGRGGPSLRPPAAAVPAPAAPGKAQGGRVELPAGRGSPSPAGTPREPAGSRRNSVMGMKMRVRAEAAWPRCPKAAVSGAASERQCLREGSLVISVLFKGDLPGGGSRTAALEPVASGAQRSIPSPSLHSPNWARPPPHQ